MSIRLFAKIRSKISAGSNRSVRAKKSILRMFMNKGLSIILSMLYVPLFLDCLDKTRYGIWIAVMGIITWIGFLDIGIGQGLRNLLSASLAKKDFQTARKLVSTAYVSVGAIFTTVIIIFLLCHQWIDFYKFVNAPSNMAQEINLLLLFVVCIMCIEFILGVMKSIFFAFQMPEKNSDMSLITQGLSLLVIYLFYLTGQVETLLPIGITLTLIPCFVCLTYSIIYFRRKFKHVAPSFAYFDRMYVKKILMLGGGFFFIQISNLICFQSNELLITNIISPDVVAEYHVIYKYVSLLMFAFTIVVTPFWSATTEAYVKKDVKWIMNSEKSLLKVWGIFILAGAAVVLFSPIFFNIWLDDRLKIDMTALTMLAVYMLIQMFSNIYLSFINGIGKIRLQLYISMALPFIYIPLTIFLGNQYGVRGFIAAGIAIMSINAIVYSFQYRKIIAAINERRDGIWYQ